MPTVSFDAIVLSGGRGTRLRAGGAGGAGEAGVVSGAGVVKANLVVAGATLLERAREAVGDARTTVVVGAEVPGGPVAGIAAGLHSVHAGVVVVLACDMPLVSRDTVARLTGVLADDDACQGALLSDERGRRQYLAAAYRTAALRDAVAALGPPADRSVRRLVEGLRLREVAAHPDEAMDCDTWPDVDRAARLLEGR
jgi:molybdopterin-guanine dinucleotide biosynthesis protein A